MRNCDSMATFSVAYFFSKTSRLPSVPSTTLMVFSNFAVASVLLA